MTEREMVLSERRTPDMLRTLSEAAFTQHVNSAFKSYHSILALSRLPLATSALVVPALVRDAVSPTAAERGHALRLVLQWAVDRLAPAPVRYPLGSYRPYDDPTWRDPRWWRYNILRHRYLEPLHPDEFVEGGRYTETLIALTGIPGPDSFFDERGRAVREVAAWLRQQLISGANDEMLRRMALEETLLLLRENPAAQMLLGIAATFDEVFPRTLLLHIASDEHIAGVEAALRSLTLRRFLLADETAADLWLSPTLQGYLYERQPAEQRQRRHHLAAQFYANEGEVLRAAEHWRRAGQYVRAATILTSAAIDLLHELQIDELRDALLRFRSSQLSVQQWLEVQILLCDIASRLGQREQALAAARRALKATDDARQQARIYRRMGKLYEQYNQHHALGYYEQASRRFPNDDPELVVLLKDRGFLYVLRRSWSEAQADLELALARVPADGHELRADIYDALESLYLEQRLFEQALTFARQALALREELGYLPRVADSFNNLGLIYNAIGDYGAAITAFEEALTIYRRIDNQERIGATFLNIGMAHHLAGRRHEAIADYYRSLPLLEAAGRRFIQSRAHYNLAEAFAELEEGDQARRHWQICYELCVSSGFDDELRDLDELRVRFPALLNTTLVAPVAPQPFVNQTSLDHEEQQALDLAAHYGQVTPKSLMAAASVSKATATRRLAELARRGYLQQQGKGRATAYVLVDGAQQQSSEKVPALEQIAETLRTNTEWLAYHTVLAIGIVATNDGMPTRLLMRFSQQPDLDTFFTLEHRLAELLGRPVDLVPANSPRATNETANTWVSILS